MSDPQTNYRAYSPGGGPTSLYAFNIAQAIDQARQLRSVDDAATPKGGEPVEILAYPGQTRSS